MADDFMDTQKHHWWPCSLQQYWASESRQISQIGHDGDIRTAFSRKTNGKMSRTNFCQFTNAHLIFKKGVWASTVEPLFKEVDEKFGELVTQLAQLTDLYECGNIEDLNKDLSPVPETSIPTGLLASVASLAVRSPFFRNQCLLGANALRPDTFPAGPKDPLVAANIAQTFRSSQERLGHSGLHFIAYSDECEFIFGDGFFSSLEPGDTHQQQLKLVVPLTPNIAFLKAPVHHIYSPGLRLVRLNPDWVGYCNSITQL